MASNTAKNILKSAAEVVANTSTILVAGKAIASVIGSTATSVKDIYEEKTAENIHEEKVVEDVPDDIQTGELIKEETTVSEPLVHKETTGNSTMQVHEHISVKEESDKMVVTNATDENIIEKEELLEIVSTEPLEEEAEIEPEVDVLPEENFPAEEVPVDYLDGLDERISVPLTKDNMDQLPDTDLDLSELTDLSKW